MRNETSSLAPGSDGALGSVGAGLVVAVLKAISAICRESVVRRVIRGLLARPWAIYSLLGGKWGRFAPIARLNGSKQEQTRRRHSHRPKAAHLVSGISGP